MQKNKKVPGDIVNLHLCTTNDNHDIWFVKYQVKQTEFFVLLGYLLPFYRPNNPENQNFEKMKKAPRDIIILYKCTINGNHMIYGS